VEDEEEEEKLCLTLYLREERKGGWPSPVKGKGEEERGRRGSCARLAPPGLTVYDYGLGRGS